MNNDMTKELYHADELISAVRTSGAATLATHLTDDEIIRYVTGTCDKSQEDAIDVHLAVCTMCASRVEHLASESRPWNSPGGEKRLSELAQGILQQFTRRNTVAAADAQPDDWSPTDPTANLRLRTEAELEIFMLLDELEVVERNYDYVLPSGLHCDTYINTAKLCRSEDGLNRLAEAFNVAFSDVDFDVVVCNGWAMGTIARRLARQRALQAGHVVRVAVAEGYGSPALSEDLAADARALILIDVSITGRLLQRLARSVHRYQAVVAASGCLAAPSNGDHTPGVRALVRVDMTLNDPAHAPCPRCPTMRKLVFNPISSQMTVKKLAPRSPTQFLADYPEVTALWETLNTTRAYEHHHVEDNTHYIAFVDTAKIISHPTVGEQVVQQLSDLVVSKSPLPTVLLLPNRVRARLLATRFAEVLVNTYKHSGIELQLVQRRHGLWTVDKDTQERLRDADVLILDTAAGHGSVLDELSLLATHAGARSISAAVLLSRLTLSCEEALSCRLAGRFSRLFHLPIRPVAIRSNDRSLCPVCHQRDLLNQAAAEQMGTALRDLAHWNTNLTKRPRKSSLNATVTRESQRFLFHIPERPLLQRCRRAVASGITLHALHTAMTDGMAPLALPELKDQEIPSSNRVAMLENLPPGVFDWSDTYLDQSVEDVLAEGGDDSIWLASADILAREGKAYWVAYLKSFLERSSELQAKPRQMFWNRLAYGAFRISVQDADVREEISRIAQELYVSYRDTVAAEGIRRVIDVLIEQRDSVPTSRDLRTPAPP